MRCNICNDHCVLAYCCLTFGERGVNGQPPARREERAADRAAQTPRREPPHRDRHRTNLHRPRRRGRRRARRVHGHLPAPPAPGRASPTSPPSTEAVGGAESDVACVLAAAGHVRALGRPGRRRRRSGDHLVEAIGALRRRRLRRAPRPRPPHRASTSAPPGTAPPTPTRWRTATRAGSAASAHVRRRPWTSTPCRSGRGAAPVGHHARRSPPTASA